METKHTPGPWQCDSEGGDGYAINADAGRSWKHIALVKANKMGSAAVGDEEAEANARLIAAAPLLLAALEKLLHETDNGTQICGENIVVDARAAIALATGK